MLRSSAAFLNTRIFIQFISIPNLQEAQNINIRVFGSRSLADRLFCLASLFEL